MRGIRQEMTVRRLDDKFQIKVYEMHGRESVLNKQMP
jgi:hypothetical protein